MTLNVAREVADLQLMTAKQLQVRYQEVFGEPARSGNKDFLWKRIIWRMQCLAEGDLSERARRRAQELANDADLRVRRPLEKVEAPPEPDEQTVEVPLPTGPVDLLPGMTLSKQYKGKTVTVHVKDGGFEYDSRLYRSLSAVAKAITGSHWNGNYFFGLKGKGKA